MLKHTLLIVCMLSCNGLEFINIDIDAQKLYDKVINKFWLSTGFCPPLPHEKAADYFLSKDMELNLALIGALSDGNTMQVRIHWLLQLVNITFLNSTPNFNFTMLDKLIDLIKLNGLKPGFEVMGNPTDLFRNFENVTEIHLWHQLIKELANHYINRYGLKYVSSWNFESWNEPDNHDFDNITITEKGLLNYYDATSEGLLAASKELRLGGPANRLIPGRSPLSWALLKHCYNGTNFLTNKTSVRLDYLSTHQKGEGHSLTILTGETSIYNTIQKQFPRFSKLPFYNDEADPLVGWIHYLPWRGDATYAAIITKVISQHWHMQYSANNPLPYYTLLSNDNGFLSYQPRIFEQRTLTARFQINNTQVPYVILVQKPVYNVMKFLNYLGNKPIHYNITVNGSHVLTNTVGAIVTTQHPNKKRWTLTAIIYNSDDTNTTNNSTAKIKLRLTSLPPLNLRACWFLLDNRAKTNPFLVWQKIGRPPSPNRTQLRRVLNAQNAIRFGPFPITSDTYTGSFKLRLPGIRLLHICQETANLVAVSIRDFDKHLNQTFLPYKTKDIGSQCIKTFEIEFSKTAITGPYNRINHKDTIFNVFYYLPRVSRRLNETDLSVRGFYRVRVIDYWNHSGPYSKPFNYGIE